jgi:hypothetical protein
MNFKRIKGPMLAMISFAVVFSLSLAGTTEHSETLEKEESQIMEGSTITWLK